VCPTCPALQAAEKAMGGGSDVCVGSTERSAPGRGSPLLGAEGTASGSECAVEKNARADEHEVKHLSPVIVAVVSSRRKAVVMLFAFERSNTTLRPDIVTRTARSDTATRTGACTPAARTRDPTKIHSVASTLQLNTFASRFPCDQVSVGNSRGCSRSLP